MPDYHAIYQQQAAQYDLMVAREDYEGRLLPALNALRPLTGLDVVELGAGTGRLTAQVAPLVKSLVALDASEHMLGLLREKLPQVTTIAADNRAVPLASGIADVAIEGWAVAHSVGWYPETWRAETGKAIAEMLRLLRPGGMAVLLETLGTGNETPAPPNAELGAFYQMLEAERGFTRVALRTDYRFASPAEGQALLRFFFGDELADRVVAEQLTIVPECTGIWWRTLA
ncbi:MAG TPA: class I SAM-dependent methyltransferase [Phototrophicaceae bacterium]|nr:class I SAM-dependent methyltransferase [Phototrophicaceae bacterium]